MTKLADNMTDLQHAANRIMIRNSLKPIGVVCIIFGSLNLLGSLNGKPLSLMDIIWSIVGLLLLCVGTWVVIKPSLAGLIGACIAIGCVGVSNIIHSITVKPTSTFWLCFGILQLYWAYQYIKQYKLFSNFGVGNPSPEIISYVDQLYKDVWKSQPAVGQCILEYKTKGRPWKVWLLEDSAIAVLANGQGIVIAEKDKVSITVEGSDPKTNMLKATIKIGGDKELADIRPEYVKIYEDWKSAPVAAPVVTTES